MKADSMKALTSLDRQSLSFPDPEGAMDDPNGLLAVGGDLSVPRLIEAYRHGIFPWFDSGPPLWWSPDPRCVIVPASYQPSRSLRRKLRQGNYAITLDENFAEVIKACRLETGKAGTWITDEMEAAYLALHHEGMAHSIECHIDGQLAGGLYGLSIGKLFFGESMFHRAADASKIAFSFLMGIAHHEGSPLVDCQINNPHLVSLGAQLISRKEFLALLQNNIDKPAPDWDAARCQLAKQPTTYLERQLYPTNAIQTHKTINHSPLEGESKKTKFSLVGGQTTN